MNTLLTIDDLAARWGRRREDAVRIVREGGVPYLPLPARRRGTPMKVDWGTARFLLASVERWEQEQQVAFNPKGRSSPEPAYTPPAVSRLGEWRKRG